MHMGFIKAPWERIQHLRLATLGLKVSMNSVKELLAFAHSGGELKSTCS